MKPQPADLWTWKELSISTAKVVALIWIFDYFACHWSQARPELAHLKATAAAVAWLVAWTVFIPIRNARTWADLLPGMLLISSTGYVAIVPKPEPFPFSALLLESIACALYHGASTAVVFRTTSWCASLWRRRAGKDKPTQYAAAELSPTPDGTWT